MIGKNQGVGKLYLKRISIQNTGPVQNLEIDLPFVNDLPMPICLVGGNGSGKSTVVSTVVNGMVAAKGAAFADAEIEKGKVYRLRSPQFIHHGQHYYHTLVQFTDDIEIEEWVLDRTREKFESEFGYSPAVASWNQIPQTELGHFRQVPLPNSQVNIAKIEKAFSDGCVLYFPPNRFEEPAWLNEDNLSGVASFEQRKNVKGFSERLIFSQRRVSATCDWLLNVLLDRLTTEVQHVPVTIDTPPAPKEIVTMRRDVDGPNSRILQAVTDVMKMIFANDEQCQVQLFIGSKHGRQLGVSIAYPDGRQKVIPNVFALSSGESSLFALFATILFDFDRSGTAFTTVQNVTGMVVVDEIDTHLHLDLQRKVLPKLLRMFERVQFIITTHSPLFLLGLRDAFAPSPVQVVGLPFGQPIAIEEFSEFDSAYEAFKETTRYRNSVAAAVLRSRRPLLVVEGRSDKLILEVAWKKLYGETSDLPFDIQSAGIDADVEKRDGGAEQLRRSIEFLATTSERPIVGLFDNDRAGNAQYKGLNKNAFEGWLITSTHRKHLSEQVWGMLLPVVAGREEFVTEENINHRYLSIEHYFSDHVLVSAGMKGDGILGTDVFEITGDKIAFAQGCDSLDASEFSGFQTLFEAIGVACSEFALSRAESIVEEPSS